MLRMNLHLRAMSILVLGWGLCEPASGEEYTVEHVGNEWRCKREDFHFLTVIEYVPDVSTPMVLRHVFFIRSHPGLDVNGWGTTWQAMPFLSGATLDHLTSLSVTPASDHIDVTASGNVSRGSGLTYGTWSAQLQFQHNPIAKRVTGSGSYSITLDGLLAGLGDLNLYLLSSNYLRNVPLQKCVIGDTGDMTNLDATYLDGHHNIWTPPGSTCPQEITNSLSVRVNGNLNIVNTRAQGLPFQIAAAYKPTVEVDLASSQANLPMFLCAFYAFGQSQNFAADNVGINALIRSSSLFTQYDFTVMFDSTALPGDANDVDFDGILDEVDTFPFCPTCPGNLTCPVGPTIDRQRDGRDIRSFVDCVLSGNPTTFGCGCADMDGNNLLDEADSALFVSLFLGSPPSCP